MAMVRILVADHQPLFREGICAIVSQIMALSGRASECEEVSSLAGFVQCLDAEDSVDAAILDLSLLQGHGMAGILAVRNRLGNAPLVVLSPAGDAETIHLCMTCGVSGFLPRTAEREDILAALQTIFDGGTHLPVFAGAAASDLSFRPPGARRLEDDQEHGSLSFRQSAVLDLVKEGKSNKQIAWELSISETTVKAHMTAILRKLGVNSRAQAIVLLQRQTVGGSALTFATTGSAASLPALG